MKLEVICEIPGQGAKTVPLLFVHGANHGAWCWKEHFLPFFRSRGFPSYALSLRGHGRSEGRESLDSFSLDDYKDDVYRVMLSLKQKPVLIGHSMGGAVVQKLLHQYPEQIEAAVLLASVPPGGMLWDFLRLLFTRTGEFRRLSLFNRGKTDVFPVDLFLSDKATEQEKKALNRKLQPESFKASRECLMRVVPRKTVAKVPLLIIGSDRDQMISKKTTLSLGCFYQSEPVIFSDMGHDLMLEADWREVAEQILAFLNRNKE